MKTCPQCRRVFTDDALRFCLYDGQPLTVGPAAAPGVPRRSSGWLWALLGTGGLLAALFLLAVLVFAVRLRSARGGGADPRSSVEAAVRRADEAESRSFRSLDPVPLAACYSGDALTRELGELTSLRREGVYADSRLLDLRVGPVLLSPDGSEAQVEVSETWSLAVYSVQTQQLIRQNPSHVVPQSVHLRRTPSGWTVDQIREETAR